MPVNSSTTPSDVNKPGETTGKSSPCATNSSAAFEQSPPMTSRSPPPSPPLALSSAFLVASSAYLIRSSSTRPLSSITRIERSSHIFSSSATFCIFFNRDLAADTRFACALRSLFSSSVAAESSLKSNSVSGTARKSVNDSTCERLLACRTPSGGLPALDDDPPLLLLACPGFTTPPPATLEVPPLEPPRSALSKLALSKLELLDRSRLPVGGFGGFSVRDDDEVVVVVVVVDVSSIISIPSHSRAYRINPMCVLIDCVTESSSRGHHHHTPRTNDEPIPSMDSHPRAADREGRIKSNRTGSRRVESRTSSSVVGCNGWMVGKLGAWVGSRTRPWAGKKSRDRFRALFSISPIIDDCSIHV